MGRPAATRRRLALGARAGAGRRAAGRRRAADRCACCCSSRAGRVAGRRTAAGAVARRACSARRDVRSAASGVRGAPGRTRSGRCACAARSRCAARTRGLRVVNRVAARGLRGRHARARGLRRLARRDAEGPGRASRAPTRCTARAARGAGLRPRARATLDQVYGGVDAETPRRARRDRARPAARSCVYDGEPILAAFHSSSGGRTASAEEVWGSALPVPAEPRRSRARRTRPTPTGGPGSQAPHSGALSPRWGCDSARVTEVRVEERTAERSGPHASRCAGRTGAARLEARALRDALGDATSCAARSSRSARSSDALHLRRLRTRSRSRHEPVGSRSDGQRGADYRADPRGVLSRARRCARHGGALSMLAALRSRSRRPIRSSRPSGCSLPMIAIFLIFYFLLIRPQQQQAARAGGAC